MTINEMVVDSFKDIEIGRELTNSEIIDIINIKYKSISKGNFSPADMCHNRTNKGIEVQNERNKRIFIWVRRGLYRYVGPDYIMKKDEIVYSDPKNCK